MRKVNIREAQLVEELKKRGQLDSKEIIDLFGVSESTARRMCVDLERKGLAIRTFGGIRCIPESTQGGSYSYNISETEHADLKQKIGEYASRLVKDGDVIFLNGGTTVQKMAEALIERIRAEDMKNVMILTNSISSAELLARHCTVMLTGGKLRVERRDMAGFMSEQTIRNAHFDKCFIGVDGIDLNEGLVALDLDTANLDRMVAEQSDVAYILADSSKFNKTHFMTYAQFQPKHRIITDSGIGEEIERNAQERNITIHVV